MAHWEQQPDGSYLKVAGPGAAQSPAVAARTGTNAPSGWHDFQRMAPWILGGVGGMLAPELLPEAAPWLARVAMGVGGATAGGTAGGLAQGQPPVQAAQTGLVQGGLDLAGSAALAPLVNQTARGLMAGALRVPRSLAKQFSGVNIPAEALKEGVSLKPLPVLGGGAEATATPAREAAGAVSKGLVTAASKGQPSYTVDDLAGAAIARAMRENQGSVIPPNQLAAQVDALRDQVKNAVNSVLRDRAHGVGPVDRDLWTADEVDRVRQSLQDFRVRGDTAVPPEVAQNASPNLRADILRSAKQSLYGGPRKVPGLAAARAPERAAIAVERAAQAAEVPRPPVFPGGAIRFGLPGAVGAEEYWRTRSLPEAAGSAALTGLALSPAVLSRLALMAGSAPADILARQLPRGVGALAQFAAPESQP